MLVVRVHLSCHASVARCGMPVCTVRVFAAPHTAAVPRHAFCHRTRQQLDGLLVRRLAELRCFQGSRPKNQNPVGSQVRQGELVRYQVKAKNSNVAGATVIIKDATGLPLYELTTDSFDLRNKFPLPSDFLLDRN